MKHQYYIAVILLLIVINIISFVHWNKAYDDACHMSDMIRCYQDHLDNDSLIEDYGCFDELYYDFLIEDNVDISEYSYCY